MNPVEILAACLQAFAERQKLRIHENPSDLFQPSVRGRQFTGERELQSDSHDGTIERTEADFGLIAGNYAFLVGTLTESGTPEPSSREGRDAIRQRWNQYQEQCAVSRSWLPPEQSDELSLLLTGPPGSAYDAEWLAVAAQIERDELVCRKLVWLPSEEEQEWPSDAERFVQRTCFAQPWSESGETSQVPLDDLSDVTDTLKEWESVLSNAPLDRADVDYDELIGQLIERYKA